MTAVVEYFENALMPGKPMFRCVKLSASVQVTTCAEMFKAANADAKPPERLFRCHQCPIGAKHAGVDDSNMNGLRGSSICCRCHRTDLRLIGGNVCVSCKNREYEWVKGVNAKGKPPITHPQLARRAVRYMVAGQAQRLVRNLSGSTDELVVELLRDSGKRVVMGRGLVLSVVQRQRVLF